VSSEDFTAVPGAVRGPSKAPGDSEGPIEPALLDAVGARAMRTVRTKDARQLEPRGCALQSRRVGVDSRGAPTWLVVVGKEDRIPVVRFGAKTAAAIARET
jgi:hypothetical protein